MRDSIRSLAKMAMHTLLLKNWPADQIVDQSIAIAVKLDAALKQLDVPELDPTPIQLGEFIGGAVPTNDKDLLMMIEHARDVACNARDIIARHLSHISHVTYRQVPVAKMMSALLVIESGYLQLVKVAQDLADEHRTDLPSKSEIELDDL